MAKKLVYRDNAGKRHVKEFKDSHALFQYQNTFKNLIDKIEFMKY